MTSHGRRLKKTEMMKLQGMLPSEFKVALSKAVLGKQIGNTLSVNVVEGVLARLLPQPVPLTKAPLQTDG